MKPLNELQLAKELIRFPTITPVDAGVMKFLEKKLKKLGFKTKILEFKEKNFKPVKNLYARLGSKKPNFCYAGHLDVVPPGNIKDWTINPFKPSIKKNHLIGRGANDMKSSIAAFVSAVSVFLSKKKTDLGCLKTQFIKSCQNNCFCFRQHVSPRAHLRFAQLQNVASRRQRIPMSWFMQWFWTTWFNQRRLTSFFRDFPLNQ